MDTANKNVYSNKTIHLKHNSSFKFKYIELLEKKSSKSNPLYTVEEVWKSCSWFESEGSSLIHHISIIDVSY